MRKFKKDDTGDKNRLIWFRTYAFYTSRTRKYMTFYAGIQHHVKDKNYLLYIQLLEN